MSFEERRLKVEGPFRGQSQRRVELEGEVKDVVRFEGEAVHQTEEIAEPLQQHRQGRGLTEEESVAVVLPETWSAAVRLLEKWSDGGEFEGEAVHRAQEVAEPLQQHREGHGLTEEESVAVVLPEKSSVTVGLPEKWSDGGEFEEEAVHRGEVIVEPLQQHREGRRLTEEESVVVVLPEKSSVAVVLPGKRSDGGEMEKASEFDRGSSENREAEELGAKSVGNDVVAEQSEEVRVVDCEETKKKTHVAPSEVKSGDFSDEDDWEGIEKSELDDEYAAAVKSDGHD